ncbi:capsid protein [Lamposivirus ageladense]|uniref:Capsid protein n=1 Tax=Circoviridae sp. TaxID=1954248 RepID=A0ABY4CL67_9VIRU|nr:capsid protein [Circoviridae sp.]
MPMRRGGRRGRRRAVTRVKRQYAEANINQGVKIKEMLDETGMVLMGTKDLKVQNLTIIRQGTEIDDRERQTARIVGIKIDGYFLNSFNVDGGVSPQIPLIVNMAIVFPKHDITLPTSNFFRREGGIVRGQEFYDTGNLDGLDYATKAINSDKIGVLWRKKFWLANAVTNSGYSSGSAGSTKMLTKYVPLYRSVQYTGSGADSCDDKLYLIWWCSAPSEPTGTGNTKGCYYNLRVRTYFRDPKN